MKKYNYLDGPCQQRMSVRISMRTGSKGTQPAEIIHPNGKGFLRFLLDNNSFSN